MTDLWFQGDTGVVRRRGGMLHAFGGPDAVRAVLICGLVFPHDFAQEEEQLLGHLGAFAHGIGHQLLDAGISLPERFERWATAPDVPMAELGSWEPGLMSVERMPFVGLARVFATLRVSAVIWSGAYLMTLAPTSDGVPTLVARDDLGVPPLGFDQSGP